MNTRYNSGKDTGDYLADLQTSLSKHGSAGLPVAKEMQVAILLVSLINEEALFRTVAALKTLDESHCIWEKVSGRVIKEQQSQRLCNESEEKTVSSPLGADIASKRKDYCRYLSRNYSQLGHIVRL